VKVLQAYRFALDPTAPSLPACVVRWGGAVRFNWGLARVKAALEQRAAEESPTAWRAIC